VRKLKILLPGHHVDGLLQKPLDGFVCVHGS
jgi:hypothetical protein